MICYEPSSTVRPTLDDYHHWPVEPVIFKETYKPWDEPDWKPSASEKHLMDFGCQPYYKVTGVWAKKLEEDVFLQSLEHPEPVKVGTGKYVAIGVRGEPYAMGEGTIHSRYIPTRRRFIMWLRRLFR
jgi:hypothetical protein